MVIILTTISQRLFALMEKRGISARDLSRMTGISYNTITDWKRKGTNPSSDKIMDICYALQITPETLLIGHGLDKVFEDPLILDKLEDPQERRLLEYFRRTNNRERELLWAYVEILAKTEELKYPVDLFSSKSDSGDPVKSEDQADGQNDIDL